MTARPLTQADRAEALDALARCARESNEAMQVVLATHPLRPMGCEEAEAKRGVGADRTAPQDGESGTGLTGVDPENSAPPLAKPNALAPALIPADCDATRVLAAMRAPAGDALRIRLEYFATLHPLAVAPRRFEYHRKGCDLVEVVTRCLHWWSAVGERVTVLDAAQVEGTCPYCVNDGSDCDCRMALPGFPATPGRRTLHLYAGAEFVDVRQLGGEPSQPFYWRLLPIAAVAE